MPDTAAKPRRRAAGGSLASTAKPDSRRTDTSLARYRARRDLAASTEPDHVTSTARPRHDSRASAKAPIFVVQRHDARRLHFDFRLELDGVLKSWAVPKGPSLDPKDKRMAVEVEDHPLSYARFEGTIPKGHYGAGTVEIWDEGTWVPEGDPHRGLADGKLAFRLQGRRLRGLWALVRMKPRDGETKTAWLLLKERETAAAGKATTTPADAGPDAGPAAGALGTPAALPREFAPQLATPVDAPPPGPDWIAELKFDGYRLLTRKSGREVHCYTRNGHDWSDRVPEIVAACRRLPLEDGWIDGEIIVVDEHGRPDFQALQNAFDTGRSLDIVYCLFDLPFADGRDLRRVPLRRRRARLEQILAGRPGGLDGDDADPLRFSQALAGAPAALLEQAARGGLEGLILKRADAPYLSRRTGDWLKLKTRQRQEFVIGGWTDPMGSRQGFGALLLGVHDDQGRLRFAGSVGTGFDESSLRLLSARLAPLATDRSPFHDAPDKVGTTRRQVPHWVRPELLGEISFAHWTRDHRIRHAVWHGLRDDRPARDIRREVPEPAPGAGAVRKSSKDEPPRVTHGDRVVDRSSGVTKADIAAHYARVAPLMQPHLRDRPVALLRAPKGLEGSQFFQKHAEASALPHVRQLDPSLDPDHAPLLVADNAKALATLAQMNVLEIHTWNATARQFDRPDRIVFDLDPGEGVAFDRVRHAARALHAFLDELGLVAFVKTSGGKGLHLVVPLKRGDGWDDVKAFSKAVVEHVARVLPDHFVAKSGPSRRVGRIFIDYLRNGFGATTVAAWSLRARPGIGVSVPVDWNELDRITAGDHWTVKNLDERLALGNRPWQDYEASRRSLGTARRRLDGATAPTARLPTTRAGRRTRAAATTTSGQKETTMPRTEWTAKRERQYEHIKSSLREQGRPEKLATEIAARTVNKERARHGESEAASRSSTEDLSSSRRGGIRSHAGSQGRTYEQLYNEARQRGIKGRSTMTKAQLSRALAR